MNKVSYTGVTILMMMITIFSSCDQNKSWKLDSPDRTLLMTVRLEKNASNKTVLVYQVDRKEEGKTIPVIESSPLGLIRNDQQFNEQLAFVSEKEGKTIDETYTMMVGRQREIRNNANELELTFKNEHGKQIQLVLRVYNEGVAFKYVFPEKSDELYTVTNELTGFKIPIPGKAWIQEYDVPSQWTPAYEKYYENGIPIGTSSHNKEGWAFPALFHANNTWMLISEANLTSNYTGIRMEQNPKDGLYKVRFPDALDAEGTGAVDPVSTLPWNMPWRTIIIGKSLASIMESQMIYNVSEEPIRGDFSWVKPGRASWSWLTDNDSPKNFNELKSFVDLSVAMKWEYSLVDANWDVMKGGTIEQLVRYANSKGVGILMWYNSGGPHNKVTEGPRDIMNDATRRKAEFKKLNEWGVKGVKVDFWHSDKQNLITQYVDVLKDAAAYQIMVNFHGCTIPRGWSRTYPNLVTMESVRGEECYLFDSTYTENAPVQNTILPFTRNAIGPMDYTPVMFSEVKFPHLTSHAHELALSIIFESGIQHFADRIDSYRSQPDQVLNFLKEVPTTWDDTRFIDGYPGEWVVLARKKGTKIYVAGINSSQKSRSVEFKIPFLESGRPYMLQLIKDGESFREFAFETKAISKEETLLVELLPAGGFVAVIY